MKVKAGVSAIRWALIPAVLTVSSACSLISGGPALEVKPVESGFSQAALPDDVLYKAAVRAIDVRDYGAALDYLQSARQKKSDDIRVLNAFGVVYDKLGRFDLSARYYAEAQKLDPRSAIVAANLAYSARLRETAASSIPSEIALAPVVPPAPDTGAMTMAPLEMEAESTPAAVAAPPRIEAVAAPRDRSPAPQFHSASATVHAPAASGAKKPLLTGHPLVIINASGQRGASEPVRRRLASRGWTTPRSAMSDGPQQSLTVIDFAVINATAAHALARTLPFSSRLVACRKQCEGLRLVLGRDFLKPRAGKPNSTALKRS